MLLITGFSRGMVGHDVYFFGALASNGERCSALSARHDSSATWVSQVTFKKHQERMFPSLWRRHSDVTDSQHPCSDQETPVRQCSLAPGTPGSQLRLHKPCHA
ncbi:uncharacterized protein LAESUDRAFT_450392 [Laetiporus sulphureus 93-53]|uniref:Uncharacterized protein n=1 Tax=Laetiporus sulphureus 93-53 TaxID=1314785 RepID=A0A165BWI8_9APHY|nr:uncharacterized protein LAESUDRAFT_450392 [Laetiporus sulphureus 93-53]KZT01779.1 hypothetical protein LAESUDRAFT_450392 [Laetiporus sulphureus 93-53]